MQVGHLKTTEMKTHLKKFMQRSPNFGRSVLLVGNAITEGKRPPCVLDYRFVVLPPLHRFVTFSRLRMVQSAWTSRDYDWNQVRLSFKYTLAASLMPQSFACATFISTACTLNTSFVPTPKTTIGTLNTHDICSNQLLPRNLRCCPVLARPDEHFRSSYIALPK